MPTVKLAKTQILHTNIVYTDRRPIHPATTETRNSPDAERQINTAQKAPG
jgi:hypothetical protein